MATFSSPPDRSFDDGHDGHDGHDDSDDHDDLIEDDELTPPEEPTPIVDVSWPIQIAKVERTIYALHRDWVAKSLELSGEPELDFAWGQRRQSKLVESVLARIPLPVFYLSEEDEERTVVIDGAQRLRALFDFYEGEYALEGLNFMPEIEGKQFGDLNGRLQRRFENAPLSCFVIQPGTRPEVKYEIFERLNTGILMRSAQEMRNRLFPGPGLTMVKRIASTSFRDVAGLQEENRLTRVEELVLRGFAFMDLGVDAYRGDFNHFLIHELGRLNTQKAHARDELELRFRNALGWTQRVFQGHAFRRYHSTKSVWLSQVSGPLVEIFLSGFDRYFPPTREPRAGVEPEIVERFQKLCRDNRFVDSILVGPQSKHATKLRFELWMKELADVA